MESKLRSTRNATDRSPLHRFPRCPRDEGASRNRERRSPILHVQADLAHQIEGVAAGDGALAKTVVEVDPAVLQPVLEVDVAEPGRGRVVGDAGESQIVGGHEPDRAAIEQAADQGFGARCPVVGIRPVEDLVQEKQHGHGKATGTELGNEPCSCGSLTGPLMAGYLRLVDEDASEEELQAWVVDSPLSVAEMQAGIEAMSNPGTPVAWFCEHGRLQTMLFGEGPPPDLADVG